MKKIRFSAFETNSSSSHSLGVCSKEQLEKWKADELRFYRYENRFIPTNEIITDEDDENFDEDIAYASQAWGDEMWDFMTREYVTESGETIIAFMFEYGC